MQMEKEAIEKILELAGVQTIEIEGRTWARANDPIHWIDKPEEKAPAPLMVAKLYSLVDYLAANPDNLDLTKIVVHIVDGQRVEVFGPLMPSAGNIRLIYLVAKAYDAGFLFDNFLRLEDFVIALQACFEPSQEVANIVLMLANLANETIRQNQDDGFSQSLQIKTGLTTKAEVKVTNPVSLAPFRTFRDVEQPPGNFILRLREQNQGPPSVGLFMADTKGWHLAAMQSIDEALTAWFSNTGLGNIKVIS